MTFSEKLQLVRKSRGLTQEKLAEALNISRQAVAKWEAGQAYPDIVNLIEISRLFLVTVDYLVKDDACQKQPLDHTEDPDSIVRFLLEAKQKTYAGKGAESESSRPCSHDFQYRKDDLLYIDTYIGGEQFAGEEAVWRLGKPVWSMNYIGRVLDACFHGDFLKAALLKVPAHMPFRGPEVFQDGDSLYRCDVTGGLNWFQGYEEINVGSVRSYECFFHGGVLR